MLRPRYIQQGDIRTSCARPVVSAILGLCILFCLLSSSVLALAAQVSDPSNPLYAIRRWAQQVQVQFSFNPRVCCVRERSAGEPPNRVKTPVLGSPL